MEKDIPAMIYYPVALHNQKAYKSDKFKEEDYPVDSMEAETHKGRIYFGKINVELTDEELTTFED